MDGFTRYRFTCAFCKAEVSQQVDVNDGIPCAPDGFARLLIEGRIVYVCNECFAAFSQLYAIYEGGQYEFVGAELPPANTKLKTKEQECQEAINSYAEELNLEVGTEIYNSLVEMTRKMFFPESIDVEKEHKELQEAIDNLFEDNLVDADGKSRIETAMLSACDVPSINSVWEEIKQIVANAAAKHKEDNVCVQYSPMWEKTFFTFVKKTFADNGVAFLKPSAKIKIKNRNFKEVVSNIVALSGFVKNKEAIAGLDFTKVWAAGMEVPEEAGFETEGFYGIHELQTGMTAMGLRVYSNEAERWVQTAWFSDFSHLFVVVLNKGTENDMIKQLVDETPIANEITLSIVRSETRFEIDGEKFPLKNYSHVVDVTPIKARLLDLCKRRDIAMDELLIPVAVRFYNNGKVRLFGNEKTIAKTLLDVVFGGNCKELLENLPKKFWNESDQIDTNDLSRFNIDCINEEWCYNILMIANTFDLWLSNDSKYFIGKRKNIIDFLSYVFYNRELLQSGLRADSSARKKLAERIPDMERRFEKVG